jgi:guanylate kinase
MSRSKLVILVGASCSGKTGLSKEAMSAFPDWQFIRSYTTRAKRPPPHDAEDEKSYRFFSMEAYLTMKERGELITDVPFREARYGLSEKEFGAVLQKGNGLIPLVADVAEIIHERFKRLYCVKAVLLLPSLKRLAINTAYRKESHNLHKIIAAQNELEDRRWSIPIIRVRPHLRRKDGRIIRKIFGRWPS